MRWIWSKIGSSLHFGWQDAWQTIGQRMTFPLTILLVTVVLAIVLATRQPVAFLTFVAYPVMLAGAYVFFVGRRLTGWSRHWKRYPQISPDGMRIDAQLLSKGPPMHMPLPAPCELSSVVRDPAGQESRIHDVRALAGRGCVYFSYPGPGGNTVPLAPGSYWISWQWRKPEKSLKWHVYDAHRFAVPGPVASLPPAGGSSVGTSQASSGP